MIYRNDSDSALSAMEAERTGYYGLLEEDEDSDDCEEECY